MTNAKIVKTTSVKGEIARASGNLLEKAKTTDFSQCVNSGIEKVSDYVTKKPIQSLFWAALAGSAITLLMQRKK